MCGIIGCTANHSVVQTVVDGLKRLEYRGYDSSGIALVSDGIKTIKAVGRVKALEQKVLGERATTAIGHTRWATHGIANEQNCHPHLSSGGDFAVVHNGIIENFAELKDFLLQRGFEFYSETDTEVIAKLIGYYYRGDTARAVVKATRRLVGSFALGIVRSGENKIYAIRRENPLIIGLGENFNMIASDMPAISHLTDKFVLPECDELVELCAESCNFYNTNLEPIKKTPQTVRVEQNTFDKGGYSHYMLKEIYEQPTAVDKTLRKYIVDGHISLPLKNYERLSIVACGSAFHAGLMAKYFIERVAGIPVDVELASEFRYRQIPSQNGRAVIAISQSGETADTISAINHAKAQGMDAYCIVNQKNSTLSRICTPLYTEAGVERAVATTKGFLTQVIVAYLIGLSHSMDKSLLYGIENFGRDLKTALNSTDLIQPLCSRFYTCPYMMFMGRGDDFPAAREGALKLKEISYICAEAYAAGELKHGSISLITPGVPVIVLANDPSTGSKTLGNIIEVRSRGGTVITFSSLSGYGLKEASDYFVPVPPSPLASLLSVAELQIFAYYIALAKGCDIDKPRNLAKSVTVE